MLSSKRTNGFVYDGEHIALVFDGEGNQTERFLHGTGIDEVIAQEGAEVLWGLGDHQGSIRDLVDENGNLVNHIVYDSFGQVTSETDPTVGFRFGYTGRESDEETGLYYYRARYYDPNVGRFISEDPIGFGGGDANLYRYVFNSPLNYTDPSGHGALGRAVGGAIGAGGGTLVAPGVGTVGGGAAGATKGTGIGAGIGAGVGAGIGANLGDQIEDFIRSIPRPDLDPNYDRQSRDIALPNFEIPSFPSSVGDLFDNIFKFPGRRKHRVRATKCNKRLKPIWCLRSNPENTQALICYFLNFWLVSLMKNRPFLTLLFPT